MADAAAAPLAAVEAHLNRIAHDASLALEPGALEDARRLADVLRQEDSHDLRSWQRLGLLHWCRYEARPAAEGRDDLDAAIGSFRSCIIAAHEDDTCRAEYLGYLHGALMARYHMTGDLADLHEAIKAIRAAIEIAPPGDVSRAGFLANLGGSLVRRYEETGDPADLDQAIDTVTEAIRSGRPDSVERAGFLLNRCAALCRRYELSGDAADLNGAVTAADEAAHASQAGQSDQVASMSNLSAVLRMRYESGGDPADLDGAIAAARQAVDTTPLGHAGRPAFLTNLGGALRIRYERSGDLADLDEAIAASRQAVDASPAGHPDRARFLSNLGLAEARRFERAGDPADLDGAVAAARRAVDATPVDHPDRARFLSNLGITLRTRYEWAGQPTDLNEAIAVDRQAIEPTPADHPDRARYLANFGTALRNRFERAGDLADLDSAIAVLRQAVHATPIGHPDRAALLSNLGGALERRCARANTPNDGDEAIAVLQEALSAAPADYPGRAVMLSNLSVACQHRSDRTGQLNDSDAAISAIRAAVQAAPPDHPLLAAYLSNLGIVLRQRHEQTGAADDLTLAVTAGYRSIELTPDDHPDRAMYLFHLGSALLRLSQLTGSPDEARAAGDAFSNAVKVASADPSIRVLAARAAASVLADSDAAQAAHVLDTAVRLLPQTAPRELRQSDQQFALAGFAGLASDAAALVLSTGEPGAAERALGLLELGRAVLYSQALDTHSDLSDLRIGYPQLAARFLELRDELDRARAFGFSPAILVADGQDLASAHEATVERRHRAAAEFAALIDSIRVLPGYEMFLLPPGPDRLTRLAHHGPVVALNASRYRSDAIVLTEQAITHIHLPGLDLATVVQKTRAFRGALLIHTGTRADGAAEDGTQETLNDILEWLWDAAAGPVLDHLGYRSTPVRGQEWPRVWWSPSGLLSMLPWHAAGHHRRNGDLTVIDRVISSYTPTIRALARARDRDTGTPPRRSLVVAMPNTPGASALPNVAHEAMLVRDLLPDPTVMIQDGAACELAPVKATVLAQLPQAQIAHFACHAVSDDADPSRSRLFLSDHEQDPLTVGSLASVRLDHAQLAYLSACQTSLTALPDLLDEAIHLTSAFQLAGYPHVIGTLWEVGDRTAARMASIFYQKLQIAPRTFDTTGSARALHEATRTLRDRTPGTPFLWAAHLHAGS